MTLKDFRKFDTNISSENVPKGPLVNMSGFEGSKGTPFTVTVLAYLPDNPLQTNRKERWFTASRKRNLFKLLRDYTNQNTK